MEIQHNGGKEEGMFYIESDGKRVAAITYSPRGNDVIVIDHTEVDRSLRGQNIGYELVQKVAEYARAEGLKVSPVCPFAAAIFEKKPELQDVAAPGPSKGGF
jgi:predicted GNAT family acetyltransferase